VLLDAGSLMNEAEDTTELLQRAAAGDGSAAAALFAPHQERLRRMIHLRLDPRLRGRVDAEDILQETYLEVVQRLKSYAQQPPMSLALWLRLLAGQKLIDAARHHLGVQKRSVGMEVSLYRGPMPEATSAALADQLLGRLTTPSAAAVRAETQAKVQEVINALD